MFLSLSTDSSLRSTQPSVILVICIEDLLREEAADVVAALKGAGFKRVVMRTGDGMDDSPALSAADAGIAISDGAQLAREIAITIDADNLSGFMTLK